MPVRSLSSPVFKWPDHHTVHAAVCVWAEQLVQSRPDILRIGYIGSYARGDWGVGSDLDLIVILESCEAPFWGRALDLDLNNIPVPVDVLVYSHQEWQTLADQRGRFYRTVKEEAVWVFKREDEEARNNPE